MEIESRPNLPWTQHRSSLGPGTLLLKAMSSLCVTLPHKRMPRYSSAKPLNPTSPSPVNYNVAMSRVYYPQQPIADQGQALDLRK